MNKYRLRCYVVWLAVCVVLIMPLSFSSASTDTCTNCHTSLEKLRALAPSPPPAKKLSQGEG